MKPCYVCKAETLTNSCSCGNVSYCGVDCQKSDWKSHKPDCPPFKVTKMPGRGRGIVATRKINVGEVIMEETPLMVIDSPNSEVAVDVFKTEFAKIDDKVKQTILTLFDPINDELKLELQSSISDIEREIKKQKEADPENETVNQLTEKLQSLGADLVKDTEADSEGDITEAALRIFSGNSLQVCCH